MQTLYESFLSSIALFPNAYAAGLIISAVCGFMGVFVVVKRVVFIGITLSEVAACGIAAAMVLHWPPYVGAGLLTMAAVLFLAQPANETQIPRDALLGFIFVAAASLSILLVAKSGFGLHEVKSLLYGDLILTSFFDLKILAFSVIPAAILLLLFFRPILYSLFDSDGARVLGIRARAWETAYFIVLGLVVSAAAKVAGAILVFCYLVVTPSCGLMLSRNLVKVFVLAVSLSLVTTCTGLLLSFNTDSPANQTIAALSCGLFFLIALIKALMRFVRR